MSSRRKIAFRLFWLVWVLVCAIDVVNGVLNDTDDTVRIVIPVLYYFQLTPVSMGIHFFLSLLFLFLSNGLSVSNAGRGIWAVASACCAGMWFFIAFCFWQSPYYGNAVTFVAIFTATTWGIGALLWFRAIIRSDPEIQIFGVDQFQD